MANQIKITADTKEVTKSILDISKSMKTLGKSDVSFISKEEREFFSKALKGHIDKMTSALNKKNSEIKKAIEYQKKLVKGSEEEIRHQTKLIGLLRQKTGMASNLSKLKSGASLVGGGSVGGMGGLMSKIPGLGILSKLGPVGMALSGGAALGGFALSRGSKALDTYRSGLSDRLLMRGRGMSDLSLNDAGRASSAGISSLEMRSRRLSSSDAFGSAGASQSSVLKRAEFERNFGVQGGTLTNLGAGLRQTMGGSNASAAMNKMQATILASGIEDAIGPYLETATNLLSNINENGSLNSTEILSVLSELSKNGKDSPEQVAKAFTNMQNAITGSSGEASSFFQTAFAKAGIGDGTIGSTKAAIESGGLFGVDGNSLQGLGSGDKRASLIKKLEGLGLINGKGDFKKRTKAVLNQFKQRMGLEEGDSLKDANRQQLLKGGILAQNMGMGREALDGVQALSRLEEASNGNLTSKKFKESLRDLNMSPELKNLNDIKKSSEGQAASITTLNKTISDELGNKLNPTALIMAKSMLSVDKTLLGVADFFGFGEESNKDKANKKSRHFFDTLKEHSEAKNRKKDKELEAKPKKNYMSLDHDESLKYLKKISESVAKPPKPQGTPSGLSKVTNQVNE